MNKDYNGAAYLAVEKFKISTDALKALKAWDALQVLALQTLKKLQLQRGKTEWVVVGVEH